jgi:hypothetical protein
VTYKIYCALGEHMHITFLIFEFYRLMMGARVSVVVKALCYKPEGRGFDTR